mgnify:CR=1 FL=1
MKFFALFIYRPVATILISIAITLCGVLAFRLLPVAPLPQVDFPVIMISASLPGASPETMASSVATPLERSLGRIAGVNEMTSMSSLGSTRIILEFNFDRDINGAARDVQAAINAAQSLLPSGMPSRPTWRKANPSDAPIMILTLTSDTYSQGELYDFASTQLAQTIAQIDGVGDVDVGGSSLPAVRVGLNPQALFNQGVSLDDVRSAISNANVRKPQGAIEDGSHRWQIHTNDELKTASEYQPLIIHYNNGAAVRLSDVASVTDSVQDVRNAGMTNAKPAILLMIRKLPEANIIETVNSIRARLPDLQETIPAAIDLQIAQDRSPTIRASLEEVEQTLVISVGLVILVVFLFLRSGRATLIPAVAVPVSLIGTFAAMYLCGFSLNNLSLMALTIATGFVVDDAIVMIENIARYVEEGEPPLQAALKGAKQIGFTIISLTISLIAVLIPLLFMGDVVGRLFHEFAITMAVAILLSAVVSLTLTPMLCARLLRHTPEESHGRLYQATGRFFDRTIDHYGRALHWVLNRQGLTWLVFGATLVLTVVLYLVVPKGFFPVQDTGTLQATTEADQSISFAAMAERQQQLAERILQDPAVKSVSSFIGVDGANTTLNTGRLLIDLKPHAERDRAPVVLRRLADETRDIVGIRLYAQPVQDLTIEDRVARTQYQLLLSSPDMAQLQTSTADLVQRMRALPQLADVASDLQNQGLQAFVQIDRAQASRLGVTVAGIDTALYNAFGQRLISTIFTQSNQYRVVLEVAPQFKLGPEALNSIYVTSSAGKPVALSSVARIEERPMPLAVNHVGQLPAATISFNTAPGVALGDAVKAIQTEQAAAREAGQLPLSVDTNFQGAALAFQASLSNTLLLILAAVVTMYIVLGVLYESTIHPVTILSTLPSAGVGALLALWMAGLDVDIVAVIGIVLLIGIVKKNAIMMIDFALEAQRDQGLPAREAIYQACLLRFRPILMTTLAALLGALPLMLGGGVGSELRHPLGVTMVGGLIVSQLLTLFTTPVIYLTFEGWAERWRARRGAV